MEAGSGTSLEGRNAPERWVSITKAMDRTSSDLALAVSNGRALGHAMIKGIDSRTSKVTLSVELTSVLVSSIAFGSGGKAASGRPALETVTLDYAKLQLTYRGGADRASAPLFDWSTR